MNYLRASSVFFTFQVFDLHRHKIDHITIPSRRGPEYGVLRRVDDVRLLNLVFLLNITFLVEKSINTGVF